MNLAQNDLHVNVKLYFTPKIKREILFFLHCAIIFENERQKYIKRLNENLARFGKILMAKYFIFIGE